MRGRFVCFAGNYYAPPATPREHYQGQRSTREAALKLLADSCGTLWWYQILDTKTMEWEDGEINALPVFSS